MAPSTATPTVAPIIRAVLAAPAAAPACAFGAAETATESNGPPKPTQIARDRGSGPMLNDLLSGIVDTC